MDTACATPGAANELEIMVRIAFNISFEADALFARNEMLIRERPINEQSTPTSSY
jgi:hypothetical protein